MDELARGTVRRSARMFALPVGYAGRAVLGVGRRLAGQSADVVRGELAERTAAHVFSVLGELKGGAQKLGQVLSVFEAALPGELAAPYRAALNRLQEAAPAMPAGTIHGVLAQELGPQWRRRLRQFQDTPAASASIGQVHRAVWPDGRTVAVKVQYPGAAAALESDLGHVRRLGRMLRPFSGDLDLVGIVDELRDRVVEELDYEREAAAQSTFAQAYRDDPDVVVPAVLRSTPRVLVQEWLEGTSLATVIERGSQAERDHAGTLLVRFLLSSPSRCGLLHADPHPGNYRITADGRLGVLDFGAVLAMPDGFPTDIGRVMSAAAADDPAALLEALRTAGMVQDGREVDPQRLYRQMAPFAEPMRHEVFRFSRQWLREQMRGAANLRDGAAVARSISIPRDQAMLNRVWLGELALLCQLEAEVAYRAQAQRYLAGFATT